MLSTIVISPRERFSSILQTLRSLFETIPPEVPVTVVDGALPEDIKADMAAMAQSRPFEHISLPYPICPNVARNIGAQRAETEFVVLADNDMTFEPGWLDAMEAIAVAHRADAVAPVIFNAPSDPLIVHHAGGILKPRAHGDGLMMTEQHRLINKHWVDVRDDIETLAPPHTDVCEFHCMMARRSYLEQVGWLDERLVTREQIDFALQLKATGGKAVFCKEALVHHHNFDPFDRLDDLHYFLFRWSDANVVRALDAFEANWDVAAERERVRNGWIKGHRRRAVLSYYRKMASILGAGITGRIAVPYEEARSARRFEAVLADAPPPRETARFTRPATTFMTAPDADQAA
jgi:glycosyltransferase involved in cell wall biosynthesis